MSPTEIAARRHYEKHLRAQGHAKSWAVRTATAATLQECLEGIPLWRRILARLGRMP
jgi:hypothetical protein